MLKRPPARTSASALSVGPASGPHHCNISSGVVIAMIRAADRWRAIKFTDFERRQIAAVRG